MVFLYGYLQQLLEWHEFLDEDCYIFSGLYGLKQAPLV